MTPKPWEDIEWVEANIHKLSTNHANTAKAYWFNRWAFETGSDIDKAVYDMVVSAIKFNTAGFIYAPYVPIMTTTAKIITGISNGDI